MTFEPIIFSSLATQIHVVSATVSIIGAFVLLLSKKGTPRHKFIGKLWVGSMGIAAISSFMISDIRMIGRFSPIHLLSLLTLYGLYQIVATARRREIKNHAKAVTDLVFRALGIAGAFAFLPGRRMNAVFFGGDSVLGFVFVTAIILSLWVLNHKRGPQNSHFTS